MNLRSHMAPDSKQLAQFQDQGYFIARGVLSRDQAMEVRGVIKDHIQRPDVANIGHDADPMDPMKDDTPDARAARFRKLGNLGVASPVLWQNVYTNPNVLGLARHYLGNDVLLKFNSCFLKPAKTGSATPWHQDNGLWRDGETEPFNFWIAIDPATQANGCLQFIPGTHREAITPHVLYNDSIHGELPHEAVDAMKAKHGGVHHIELEPGDAVCWQSSLYHYSPPNASPNSRVAVAGVMTNPTIAERTIRFKSLTWCMRGGDIIHSFPPEKFTVPGEPRPIPPFPTAEAALPTGA